MRDEFVDRLARRVTETVLLGDPFVDGTTMGPLNNEGVAVKMDEHVSDAVNRGAEVVAGGERADGYPTDLYWQPTVLSGVPADARVAVEETFGPVAPVVTIGSLEEAIEQANAWPYGLLAAIFTRDLAKGLRFADGVRDGVGEHQRVVELLGGAPAVRRARGHRQRPRPRGRQPRDADVHRAADRDASPSDPTPPRRKLR